MTSYFWFPFLCVLCVSAVSSQSLTAGAGEGKARLPNIVFILADDLGYGDPGCYNPQSRIPTPNIDRLAAQGMRFTDAHTPSAVCTPTRYGLLTGRYCWRSRLKRGVLQGYDPLLIEPGRATIASMLKGRGYATACVGKWHLGLGEAAKTDYDRPLRPGPTTVGFDYFFGIPASLDMPPYLFVENERPVEAATAMIGASEMRRKGGGGFWRAGAIAPGFKHEDVLPKLTEKSVEFIQNQSASKPFFLYLPLNSPHTPWMPTPEFRGKSGVDWYGDFVVQTDATVGRVLQALDERKLADNTLLIFASDNGAHWLAEDIAGHGHRANLNWRGQKADVWEAGHRVPFVARWPGKVRGGSRCDQTLCLTDMFATFAAAAGAEVPGNAAEDSVSILPLVEGRTDRPIREAVVHHSGSGVFAIRAGDWKLVEGLGSGGFSDPKTEAPQPGGPEGQLYNLAEDPGERNNLYLQRPAEVARLKGLLERYRTEGRSR
jgi:arylsulfatase A